MCIRDRDRIGPTHFAKLAILNWRTGDKENALVNAEKGLQAAINHKAGASEFRTIAFKRFVKTVKEGTMPKLSDVTSWQREAMQEAAAKEKKTQEKE